MKKIEAFVKPRRLDSVAQALHHMKGVSGMSVSQVRGFGRGRGGSEMSPSPEMIAGFTEVLRIEVFCQDHHVQEVVGAIEKAAHTGLRGDGKIYVLPVEEAVRISTGERGGDAV